MGFSTAGGPRARRVVLALAWYSAFIFYLLNPHRVSFASINFYLLSGVLLAGISVSYRHSSTRPRLVIGGAAVVVGVIFFGRFLHAPVIPLERPLQRSQLAVIDWTGEVAGGEPVLLIAPYHPMTVHDATDLQNAWQYALWIDEPHVRDRLREFGLQVLRTRPPIVAANPWMIHTQGRDLVSWLTEQDILTVAHSDAIRRMLTESYVRVALPPLADLRQLFGDQFWVRRDRYEAVPPPIAHIAAPDTRFP